MKNKKVCCVIGHSPKNFPWNYYNKTCASHQEYIESMSCYIDWYIRNKGINYFICGGALGVDIDFAEIVVDLRDNLYDEIKLEIAIPYRGQSSLWNKSDRAKYNSILERADRVHCFDDTYNTPCMRKLYKYMVDSADTVFAFWNKTQKSEEVYDTIVYAKQKNKNIELFILNDY